MACECAHRHHLLEDSAPSLLLVSCTHRCSGQGCTETFLLRFQNRLTIWITTSITPHWTCSRTWELRPTCWRCCGRRWGRVTALRLSGPKRSVASPGVLAGEGCPPPDERK